MRRKSEDGSLRKMLVITLCAVIGMMFVVWLVMEPERTPEEEAHFRKGVERIIALEPLFQQGDVKATFSLGKAFEDGWGVPADPNKALRLYLIAGKRGHAEAQYRAGRLYELGIGVRQNYARAAEWYNAAAKLSGYREAEFALAELHYRGRGVENNFDQALKYYRRAADKGHHGAWYFLGAMYSEGWGGEKDQALAYAYLKSALPFAEEIKEINLKYDVKKAYEKLTSEMTEHKKSRGEKKIDELKRRGML